MNYKSIGIILTIVLLMGAVAAAASYTTRESLKPEVAGTVPASQPRVRTERKYSQAQKPAQPAQPQCNDSNIVGTLAGGAVGGIAGSQIGHGNGKTAATIGGALGGAVLGNQFIPTQNVTCRH